MKLKTKLLKHQQEAFDKLKDIKACGLFMDMGTGKTRTTLEFIKYREHKVSKVIWTCPCAVKYNLMTDIKKHSDVDVGFIEDKEEHYITIVGIESISQSDMIYLKTLSITEHHPDCFIVIDESHTIKNPKSKRFQRVQTFKSNYRIILTGTPVTKNIQDLFTQFYFLHPKILGYNSFTQFAKNHLIYSDTIYNMVIGFLNEDFIHRRIAPYIYQVKKEECLDLPTRIHESRFYSVSEEVEHIYNNVKCEILEDVINNPDETFNGTYIFRLFTFLMMIASGHLESDKIDYTLEDNKRVQMLNDTLKEFEDDKIIVFYNYNKDYELISKYINKKHYNINGSVPLKDRNKIIEDFEKDDEAVLLINMRSGSYGLNLQFANCIIYYNNTFNYAIRQQSEDRIYRIGQTRQTHIVDILSDLKIDHRIDDNLQSKGELCKSLAAEIKASQNNKNRLKEIIDKIRDIF